MCLLVSSKQGPEEGKSLHRLLLDLISAQSRKEKNLGDEEETGWVFFLCSTDMQRVDDFFLCVSKTGCDRTALSVCL